MYFFLYVIYITIARLKNRNGHCCTAKIQKEFHTSPPNQIFLKLALVSKMSS